MQLRFTVRQLLIVLTIGAVAAAMTRNGDWRAAVGFVVSAAIFWIALELRFPFGSVVYGHLLRLMAFPVAGIIGWFSVVDYSVQIDWCKNCADHRWVYKYRVCGFPVLSERDVWHVSHVSYLRTDLGQSCQHQLKRQHCLRLWGLRYYARASTGKTCCLAGDPDYYNEEVSHRVRRFAAEHPDQAEELCRQVIIEDGYDAMHAFIAKMKAEDAESGHSPDARE